MVAVAYVHHYDHVTNHSKELISYMDSDKMPTHVLPESIRFSSNLSSPAHAITSLSMNRPSITREKAAPSCPRSSIIFLRGLSCLRMWIELLTDAWGRRSVNQLSPRRYSEAVGSSYGRFYGTPRQNGSGAAMLTGMEAEF